VAVELRKSFMNYGPNKRSSCNWAASHLQITAFYAKQTAPKEKVRKHLYHIQIVPLEV